VKVRLEQSQEDHLLAAAMASQMLPTSSLSGQHLHLLWSFALAHPVLTGLQATGCPWHQGNLHQNHQRVNILKAQKDYIGTL